MHLFLFNHKYLFHKSNRFKDKLFLVICLLISANGITQDWQGDPFLEKDTIDLHTEFLTIREFLKLQNDELNNGSFEQTQQIQDLLINTNAAIHYLHRNGSVIFSGEAVEYLNKLKDYLLKDYSDYREKIHIYITKDPTHNAFSIVSGNIYMNIGLLSNLENEAQLAYIMCHEIMHIVNKHSINEQLKQSGIKNRYDGLDILNNLESTILKTHSIEKLNEFQADIDGVKLYSLTKYPYAEAIKAIQQLNNYNNLNTGIQPTNELYFVTDSSINLTYVQSKFEYNKKKLNFEDKEEVVEENLTHPSIDERVKALTSLLEGQQDSLRSQLWITCDQGSFIQLKHTARDETIKEYIHADILVPVIVYSSNALLKGDTSEQTIHNLCYALSRCRYLRSIKEPILSYSDAQCDQVLSNYLDNLTLPKFNTYVSTILKQLSIKYTNAQPIISQYENQLLDLSKDTASEATLDDVEFFIDVYAGTHLKFRKEMSYNKNTSYEPIKGKIAIANVFNIAISLRDKESSPLYSEKIENQVTESLYKLAKQFPNKIVSYLPNNEQYSTKEYTDYQLINNWIYERINHNNSDYLSFYQEEMQSFSQRTGIKYIMVGENFELKGINSKLFLKAFFGSIPVPIYIPQSVIKMLINRKRKYMLTLFFDIETQKLVYWDRRSYLEPNSVAQIYQNYNNILYEISKK